MLIVNADDYGFSETVTDPILEAFARRQISSATAMVWMEDSERAGRLAREQGLPLGLHLNLTAPFSDPGAPASARDLQRELTERFGPESWRQDGVSRRRDRAIVQAVGDQLRAFRDQFGEPTHLDGHHHVHVHPQVLECLPREFAIRPVIRGPNALTKPFTRRERRLRRRFRTADGCVGLRLVHPQFGGTGLGVLGFARDRALEVMVHAQYEEERAALRSREWLEATERLGLGAYSDIAPR